MNGDKALDIVTGNQNSETVTVLLDHTGINSAKIHQIHLYV